MRDMVMGDMRGRRAAGVSRSGAMREIIDGVMSVGVVSIFRCFYFFALFDLSFVYFSVILKTALCVACLNRQMKESLIIKQSAKNVHHLLLLLV